MAKPKHAKFKTRRWPLFAIIGLFASVIGTLGVSSFQSSEYTTLAIEDVPSNQPGATPTELIKPSTVTRIYIPGIGINHEVLPLDLCRSGINPPTDGTYIAAVYQCTDFESPGTVTASAAVITGHSSCKIDTVLNRLNIHKTDLIGREVWVKTQASNTSWLIYRIESVEDLRKENLGNSERIWGSSEYSTANQLNLVTCMLDSCAGESTNNLVAIARFVEVR